MPVMILLVIAKPMTLIMFSVSDCMHQPNKQKKN